MDLLHYQLVRTYLPTMAEAIFKVSYPALARVIYPTPPYKLFLIGKRNGTVRTIAEPRRRLKVLQKRLLDWMDEQAGPPRRCVHGFVRRRSIVTNARTHCSPRTTYLLNIDLEEFFPSITFKRVVGVFRGRPFNCSVKVAQVLAHLCTFNGTLPQGAPTSPMLANLVCRMMDRDLTDLARLHRATYTRYADDLTFSFKTPRLALPSNICSFDSGELTLGDDLKAVIAKHSFTLNPAKTRLSGRSQRLEVTGLTINKFPNVKRVFVDKIRGALNAWARHGYAAAQNDWEKRCAATARLDHAKRAWKRQTRTGVPPALKNVLWGKLLHLRAVRGKDDVLYARLAERYNNLCAFEKDMGAFACSSLPVTPVVRNEEGAEDAVFVLEWEGDYQSTPGLQEDALQAQGTAFVYKELGLLVTCNHVFQTNAVFAGHEWPTDYEAAEVQNKSLTLTHPKTKEKWPAKILHRNTQYDIALVTFDVEDHPPHRFFSAMDAPIKRKAGGILIGFPNYQNYKRPDFLEEKVLNRTMPNKGMDSFVIEGAGSIRPGNSGGPFVDNRYRVAGVAQRGSTWSSGDDECLCFTILDAWIDQWKASKAPPPPLPAAEPAAGL